MRCAGLKGTSARTAGRLSVLRGGGGARLGELDMGRKERMESGHRIDARLGYLVGPPTDEAMRELEAHRPARLELVGERHDLTAFRGVSDAVRGLTLSGSTQAGRIGSIEGLGTLAQLEVLQISGKVKGGFDAAGLLSLQNADLQWQPAVNDVLALPSLQHLTVRGYAGSDLAALGASPTLESLWLATAAVQSIEGFDAFSRVSRLKLSRARKLQSLQGVQRSALRSLDVDDARALTDLSALRGVGLRRLGLISISPSASLEIVGRLAALEELIVGGTNAPTIDWPSVLSSRTLRLVSAAWDPSVHSEGALRDAVPAERAITRFDPVPGSGRRALLVGLG